MELNLTTVIIFLLTFTGLLWYMLKFTNRDLNKLRDKKLLHEVSKIEDDVDFKDENLELEAKIMSGLLDEIQTEDRFNQIIEEAKNGAFKLNAIEMAFFIRYFGERIIKSDNGNYYLIEKGAVFKFVEAVRELGLKELTQEYNNIYQEIAPKIKDGKIVVDAKQLFLKMRNETLDDFSDRSVTEVSILQVKKTIDEIKTPLNDMHITNEKVSKEPESENEKDNLEEETKKDNRPKYTKEGSLIMYHETEGDYTLVHRDGTEEEFIANASTQDKKSNPLSDALKELRSLVEVMQTNMLDSANSNNQSTQKLLETLTEKLSDNGFNSLQQVKDAKDELIDLQETKLDDNAIEPKLSINALEALKSSGLAKGLSNTGTVLPVAPMESDGDIQDDIDSFFELAGESLSKNRSEREVINEEVEALVGDLDRFTEYVEQLAVFKKDGVGGFYKHREYFYFSVGTMLALLVEKTEINKSSFYSHNKNLKYAFILKIVEVFNSACQKEYNHRFTIDNDIRNINYTLHEELYNDKIFGLSYELSLFLSPTALLEFDENVEKNIKHLKFEFSKRGIKNDKRLFK